MKTIFIFVDVSKNGCCLRCRFQMFLHPHKNSEYNTKCCSNYSRPACGAVTPPQKYTKAEKKVSFSKLGYNVKKQLIKHGYSCTKRSFSHMKCCIKASSQTRNKKIHVCFLWLHVDGTKNRQH